MRRLHEHRSHNKDYDMSFLETLTGFFARPAEETRNEVPEGACANCWGHFAYDGAVREAARDRQIDIVNGRERLAFIQGFMVDNIDGIQLKKVGESMECPRCHTPSS
jgi:hypothetical protein